MAFERLAVSLEERFQAGYLRERHCIAYEQDKIICIGDSHYLNFASNDYLGMRQHEGVLQAWVEGLAQFGGGSGASPLVTGYTQAHLALESYLADALNREAVLLFNSGFAANQALCQALFADDGNIVCDKLMHASFLDGAMASNASLVRYRHNDPEHLLARMSALPAKDTLIATEGIFSMDGDSAPLSAISEIARAHDAWLMLDDAHGFGVLGETGLGSAQAHGLDQQTLPVLMATFGKAVGTAGAFIAGSRTLIDYLINHARHYIYSTGMPAAQAVATLQSLLVIEQGDHRSRLINNIAAFRQGAAERKITLMPSDSAIQPVLVGEPAKAVALSDALKSRGIWVPAIRYPTVPKGQDRLRITLSASHTDKDINALLDALSLATESESVCS